MRDNSTFFYKVRGAGKRLILLLYPEAFPIIRNKKMDPEQRALYPYCKGIGIDVGCGSNKTHPNAIGIDITPKGKGGSHGSEKRQVSEADVCLSGDNLYLFKDGVFDYVVARHNLEHYQNPVKTLKEWKRVLKKGGLLGVVLPDDDAIDTIHLDPTHKHAFTKQGYRDLLETIGGFKILVLKDCIKKWSFVCVAKKIK